MNGAEERSPEKNDFLQGLALSSPSPIGGINKREEV
jgi:hypothetical protein